MHPPRRPVAVPVAAVAAVAGALLLAGCGSGAAGGGAAPTWVPHPDAPYRAEPGAPGGGTAGPSAPGSPPAGAPRSPGAPPSSPGGDPDVLATGLNSPVGLVLLPDGSALVGERTTGAVVRVQPRPGQPTPTVQTLTGLSTADGGGLLDLALSPHYAEDSLVYALVTTDTADAVVTFSLGGPVTDVVTGLTRGPGRLAFDPAGDLLVAAGDTLGRYDDIGRPVAATPVLATGLGAATGLCLVAAVPAGPTGATVLVTGAAPDRVSVVRPPAAPGPGLTAVPPDAAGVSGCAVTGTTLYLSTLGRGSVLAATLTPGGVAGVAAGAFTPVLRGTYGRLRTVVAAPDGALWLTTANSDGQGTPTPDDERVVRILPGAGGGGGSRA